LRGRLLKEFASTNSKGDRYEIFSTSGDAHGGDGASGDSAGDILTFGQNEVFDADDKNKVGFDQGICFRIVPGKAWECVWTLALEKGQLTVEGPFYDTWGRTPASEEQGLLILIADNKKPR
jgi:hypothetical protein